MHLRSLGCFFLALGALIVTSAPLAAQSPYAGTYHATLSTTNAGVTRLGPVEAEFSVEDDGTFTIGSGLSGTVAPDGSVTFATGAGTSGLTIGRIDNGVMAAGQIVPAIDANHTATTLLLNAPKICGLLPRWQKVSPTGLSPNFFRIAGFAFGNGVLVSLAGPIGTTAGWASMTSPDGLTWTSHPIDLGVGAQTRADSTPVRFVNGRFMFAVYGDTTGGATLHFYSSVDGIAWTGVDSGLPRDTYVTDIAYAFGKYWALRGDSNLSARALSSPDGIVWTPVALGTEVVFTERWSFGNGRLIAIPSGGVGAVGFTYQTTDGLTWTKQTYPTNGYPPNYSVFGGGRFVASSVDTLTSTDFINWTALAPGPNNTPDGFQAYSPFQHTSTESGCSDGTAFYGMSALSSGSLYRSTDGNEWRKVARQAAGNTDYVPGQVIVLNGRAVIAMQSLSTTKFDLWSVALTTDSAPVVSPPIETTRLTNLTAAVGASAGWTAQFAHGGLILHYQWQKDGVNIPGANAVTYSIQPVLATSGGVYTVVVSTTAGTVTSQPATLTVTGPVAINAFPASVAVMEGSPVNLTVSASGTNLAYQWRFNGQPLSGKTSATLSFTATLSPVVAGSYDCVVTNAYGSVTPPATQVQVLAAVPPSATGGPNLVSLAPASATTLQAGLTGALPITYQWTKDGVDLPGQTGATLSLANLQAVDGGIYRVRATNAYGTTLGPATVLTVTAPAPFQMLGRPLVKIVESATARPGDPGHLLGNLGTVRFRNQTAIFQASETGFTANGLFRWNGNALSVIASSKVTAPNGQTFKDCTAPTCEADGFVYFAATHTAAPLSALYSWNAATGALTPLVQAGAAAPGGGHFGAFSYVTASAGKLYFLSLIADGIVPGKRLFRRDAAGTISLVLDGTVDLPGSLGKFAGEASGTPPFSYDGQRLLAAFADVSGARGLFSIAEDGTVTPLISGLDLIPGTLNRFTDPGNADTESGGSIFAGSFNYEASFSAANALTSLATSGGNVTAIDAASYLRYLFRAVVYRSGNATIPVADNSQPIDGLTATAITPEAHGREAAFLVSFSSTNQAIYLALDRPATGVPAITYQPVSRLGDLGANIVLTAVASGDALNWQWYKDGVALPGANLNSLSLTPLVAGAAGSYTATATNSFGTATTTAALVTLLDPSAGVGAPSFVVQPSDQQILVGKSLTLSAVVSGGASNVRYQWFKNGVQVGNAATLSFVPATAGTAGTYRLVVTNDYGTATSRDIVVTNPLAPAPAIPANFAARGLVLDGGVISFSVPTLANQSYRVEMSVGLESANWTPVESFVGVGQDRLCSYPVSGVRRFYRVVIVP